MGTATLEASQSGERPQVEKTIIGLPPVGSAQPPSAKATPLRGAPTIVTGSFNHDTITVKVSGSVEGSQTGPFANLSFSEADRGRTLTIHVERILSVAGEELPVVPVHLYRSSIGRIAAGAELLAFSEPPLRTLEEVAADASPGTLVWTIESGDFCLFFPWTRPIVQIPAGVQPASVTYWINVE